MNLLRQTFRVWWQKPRNIADRSEERTISFLELFYDLVYVGIIFQITHALVYDVSVKGLLIYVAIYAMVWLAWINGSIYHELHGNNDIRTRVFTFLQMVALAFMGIYAPSAFGEGATGFALSYASFLLIITYLWWRTGVYDPEHKPLANPYSAAYFIATVMFVLSAFVEAPYTYYLWLSALGMTLVMPFVMQTLARNISPEHLEQGMAINGSQSERFGLLTIIVLGEVVASIMRGASHHEHVTLDIALYVIFGLIIALSMWWIYFDFAARRVPVQTTCKRLSWVYLHLPITMCIGLIAAGLLNLLEHPDYLDELGRWLIVGPIAIFLVSLVLLLKTLDVKPENKEFYTKSSMVAIVVTLVIIVLNFLNLEIMPLLILISVLMLAPIGAAFSLWIRRASQRQQQEAV